MPLTRIGSIGINTGIKFSGLTTITTLNTSIDALSIGGPVSIAGTLTYEDVTNIDSVGLITARNGIVVGSGITLSKDGDVFFTGIATGNGSGLTNLPAANLTGTLPAISGANLTGIDTDLVSDTTPQLGGNLDVNTKNIVFGDSGGASDDRLTFGAGTDLSIFHNGTNSVIADTGDGNLSLQTNGTDINLWNSTDSEYLGRFIRNGAVELYHNGEKMLETEADGIKVIDDNTSVHIRMVSSDGDAGFLYGASNTDIGLLTRDGSYAVRGVHDGKTELYYDGTVKFETHDKGTIFTEAGSSTAQGAIKVNTTLDDYGSITVRDKKDVNEAISAFQVENASNGTNETNLLLRSVNLGSTAFSHGIYAAKSHRFAVSSNTTPTVQVDSDGLKFNNDQSADNALNDYEEGSHTPSYNALSTGNVSNNFFKYVKIGGVVHFQGYQSFQSTNDSDVIQMSMPFTNSGGNSWCPFTAQTNLSGFTNGIVGRIKESSNTAEFKYMSGDGHLTYSNLNGGWLIFAGTFKTTD